MKQFLLFVFAFTCRVTFSQTDSIQAIEYLNRAEHFHKTSKPDSAIIFFTKASEKFKTIQKTNEYIHVNNMASSILIRQGKYRDALVYIANSISLARETKDTMTVNLSNTYVNLGEILALQDKLDESLINHYKALNIRFLVLGQNDPLVSSSYENIGHILYRKKDIDGALEVQLKCMKIREQVFGVNSKEVIGTYVDLGNIYKDKKEHANAIIYCDKALKAKIAHVGQLSKELVNYYTALSEAYYLKGDNKNGDFYKGKAIFLDKSK